MWPGIRGFPVRVVFSVGGWDAELFGGPFPSSSTLKYSLTNHLPALMGTVCWLKFTYLVCCLPRRWVCILGMYERIQCFNTEPDPLRNQSGRHQWMPEPSVKGCWTESLQCSNVAIQITRRRRKKSTFDNALICHHCKHVLKPGIRDNLPCASQWDDRKTMTALRKNTLTWTWCSS